MSEFRDPEFDEFDELDDPALEAEELAHVEDDSPPPEGPGPAASPEDFEPEDPDPEDTLG